MQRAASAACEPFCAVLNADLLVWAERPLASPSLTAKIAVGICSTHTCPLSENSGGGLARLWTARRYAPRIGRPGLVIPARESRESPRDLQAGKQRQLPPTLQAPLCGALSFLYPSKGVGARRSAGLPYPAVCAQPNVIRLRGSRKRSKLLHVRLPAKKKERNKISILPSLRHTKPLVFSVLWLIT